MAKHRAAKNCVVLPWLSGRADCKEGRFLQLGNSLFLSRKDKDGNEQNAFLLLSTGARMLYLSMALEAGGQRSFVFPLAAAKKYGLASTSFRRYIDELEAAGFIAVHSNANLRKENDYYFNLDWKLKPP